jgi:Recombination directionality factor-like
VNANALATTTGTGLAVEAGPSILGEKRVSLPIGGKIRPGIKVLTAAGKQHAKAQGIYDAGVAANRSWAQIEKDLKAACGFDRSPLTPKNAPYFTVFPHDFAMPEMAAEIMRLYGEDRKDGNGTQLYRFPIVFAIDVWQAILPHKLRAYTRNELKFWSDYDSDGNRRCMTHAPVEVDPKAKRAHIPFGGRQGILRPDNGGICNPEKCAEYQRGECKLSGSLLFYVPGIRGGAMISLPTTSIYSLKQMRDKLELVGHIRGGRISGTENGKALFWLTKKQQEVSMIDRETGLPKKVMQWLVVLEEDMDVSALMAAHEAPALVHQGAAAAAALEAPAPTAPVPAAHDAIEGTAEKVEKPAPATPKPEELRASIEKALEAAQIKKATFRRYVDSKYEDGWYNNAEKLAEILDIAMAAKDTPQLHAAIQSFHVEDKL